MKERPQFGGERQESSPYDTPFVVAHIEGYYNSDPRSKELRKICIAITKGLDNLVNNEKLSDETKTKIIKNIRNQGKRLEKLGVQRFMHVEEGINSLISNPVVTAEWIGGMLLPYTQASYKEEKFYAPNSVRNFNYVPGKETKVVLKRASRIYPINVFKYEPGTQTEIKLKSVKEDDKELKETMSHVANHVIDFSHYFLGIKQPKLVSKPHKTK